jgi:hypothetical protein
MAKKIIKVQVIRTYSAMKVFDVEIDTDNETSTEAIVKAEEMMSNTDLTGILQMDGQDETTVISEE